MRVSRAEMDRSHGRIVDGAASMLREHGIANTSVAQVMELAGLTHGGFYRHFKSKEALVESAIEAAFAQMKTLMECNLREKAPADARAAYHAYYLSEEHLGQPGAACPVATLAGDIARSGPELKRSFGEGVSQILDTLALGHTGSKEERRDAAIREFAMLVGAAVIARATDTVTATEIREACRPLA